jgi:hypothetical protein
VLGQPKAGLLALARGLHLKFSTHQRREAAEVEVVAEQSLAEVEAPAPQTAPHVERLTVDNSHVGRILGKGAK